MKNLPEFKALIERYESITIEEIKRESSRYHHFFSDAIIKTLTGFGGYYTCTLCCAVNRRNGNNTCYECVYGVALKSDDNPCITDPTYDAISESTTPRQLLKAIRARAAYMRTLLPN